MLELRDVSRIVGGETHLAAITLRLEPGSLNVLLGPTLSGKTSLMRVMAGLDAPSRGRVFVDGRDVTGVAVRRRNVAMVYQQFINYPAMTVFENIASPLRVAGADAATIEREVGRAAELLRLTPYMKRLPLELSGGQQQRTAIARAIVKKAGLVLLDEPLANLDYKLREELRAELPRIFAESGAIFVYATTEPSEALLLGGNTATLAKGRVTQFGPTVQVFRQPADLVTARTFSDPPLNTMGVVKQGDAIRLDGAAVPVPGPLAGLPDGDYTLAFRPHHLRLARGGETGALRIAARAGVTEITGSETFVHLTHGAGRGEAGEDWVMLMKGVHDIEPETTVDLALDPAHLLVFDRAGRSLRAGGAALASHAAVG